MSGIKLGQKVRDVVTGFEGVAVCRISWLNGCQRISVQPKATREKKGDAQSIPDSKTFDEEELEVLDDQPLNLPGSKALAAQTGGGRPDPSGMRR